MVCELNILTLHFVPANARLAFTKALKSALRGVILHNSGKARLKLFMLPKCIFPLLRCNVPNISHTSIISLCKYMVEQ